MSEWKLTKRRATCAACERAFEEAEAHVSSLSFAGEELAREDVCLSCWRGRDAARAAVWWRTRHFAARKVGLALDLDALETLFVRLGERQEIAFLELRYVLALILMRKRRLRIEQVLRDGEREALVVVRPRRPERIRVAVFDFAPEKIEELRVRLQEVFEGAEAEPGPPDAGDPAGGDAALAGRPADSL
jgi:hypothetical protein